MGYVLVEYIKCPHCGCPLEAFIHHEDYVKLIYRAEEHGCKKVFFSVDKATGETEPAGIQRISIDEYMRFIEKRKS